MSETTSKQSDNPFGRFFNPNFLSQFTTANTERFDAMLAQWESWEAQGAKQAEKAVADSADLMRATMDYSLSLQKAMREQVMANTRQMMDLFSAGEDDQ